MVAEQKVLGPAVNMSAYKTAGPLALRFFNNNRPLG